jgi:hypothetical protein
MERRTRVADELFEMKAGVMEALGLDYKRMEAASDKIVALAAELGVTRREMASMCLAIGANHMIATGVVRGRAALAMIAMYDWRAKVGVNPKLLVPE